MTSANRSSQARSTRLTSKSGRWVSRYPRDRASRSQFRERTSSDRERPARFGASLGSLTTTRPIVHPNCLPVRTRFTPAGSTNPIFCCPYCPFDRQSRLQVRVQTRSIPPRSVFDLSISHHHLKIHSADQLGPVRLGGFRVGQSLRPASGHAVAPPSAASNCRRPMVTVIRPSRARCVGNGITLRACSLPVQGGQDVLPPLSSTAGSKAASSDE